MQRGNELTDAGGRMIAEGLKGNCSVTKVGLVSLGGMLVRFVLLTCAEQSGNDGISFPVKQEITEGLRQGHGADKGIAITVGRSPGDDSKCLFLSFERLEQIDPETFDFEYKSVSLLAR